MSKAIFTLAAAVISLSVVATPALAANVKITPLGTHDGEFCAGDRALVFEDPNGTRLLYDAGRSVAGPDDPRLGKIDVLLVSHMHGDHVGDKHIAAPGEGACKETKFPVRYAQNAARSGSVPPKYSTPAQSVMRGGSPWFAGWDCATGTGGSWALPSDCLLSALSLVERWAALAAGRVAEFGTQPGHRPRLRSRFAHCVGHPGPQTAAGRRAGEPWKWRVCPIAGWPPVVDAPLAGGGIGRGALVTVTRVVGPDGEGRGLTGAGDPDALLDVLAEVWFRNARIATPARLLVTPTEVRRLH